MRNVEGEIVYDLFTVKGNETIHIHYNVLLDNSIANILNLQVVGDGPRPIELSEDGVLDEIANKCIEDARSKPVELWKEFISAYGSWGAN